MKSRRPAALRSGRVWFALMVVAAFGLVSLLAPVLAPHDPYALDFARTRLPPMWEQGGAEPGSQDHPLGTDRSGRDILSRFVYGARTAFASALAAVPLAALIGLAAGLVAGYAGGRVGAAILFVTDVVQALPPIMFMILVVLILRSALAPTWANGLLTLVVGFVAVAWTSLARLARAAARQLRTRLFVEAAAALGASPARVVVRHLLPNMLPLVAAWVINAVPAVVLLEAVLGYIGVGLTRAVDGDEFGVVSWGGLFFSGRPMLNYNALPVLAPALGLLVLTMSLVLLAESLTERTRRGAE